MDWSDEVAAEKARRGDRDAFRVLVERHSRSLFRLAFRMTASETEAEDIVQETFLRAWAQMKKFHGRAAFGTWIYRICTNHALDRIRRRQRRPEYHADDPFAHVPHGAPSPERLAQSRQIQAILLPALDGLTGIERAAFVMRHYEGLSIENISKTLGVEPGAAKHSVFRAVQKLRAALEPVRSGR